MSNCNSIRLPVHVSLRPGELPRSFVSRVSRANGFRSTSQFCRVTGLNEARLRLLDEDTALKLQGWTGADPNHLLKFALKPGSVVTLGSASIKRSQLSLTGYRYCPLCLREEAERDVGRPATRPYLRAFWSWKMIHGCPEHGVPLVHTQNVGDGFDDLGSWIRADADLETGQKSGHGGHPADQYFASRIMGGSGSSFLDQLPAYVAAELCTVLGRLQRASTERRPGRTPKGFRDFESRYAGFEIASMGVESISHFLTRHVDQMLGKVIEYRRVYSAALLWLATKKTQPDYAMVIALFQDHAENHIPFGEGDIFLTVVGDRKVHSLKSASQEYGLAEDRIRNLLAQAKVFAADETSTCAKPLFRKEDVHALLVDAQRQMTTSEAAAALGCSLPRLEYLLANGILRYVANDPSADRVFRRIHADEIERFRGELRRKMMPAEAGMVSISSASAICHCTVDEIFSLLFSGRLRRLSFQGGEVLLSTLVVDPKELSGLVELPGTEGLLDVSALERKLRTTTATVNELIKRGFLPVVICRHRKTRVEQRYVEPDVADAFVKTHISLSTMARETGRHIAAVRDELEKWGIRPIFEPTGKIARFYLREQVRPFGLA